MWAVVLAGCSAPVTTSTPVPSATAEPGHACLVAPQTGLMRTNTLVDIRIDSDGLSDRITFLLGAPVAEPTGGTGRLKAVEPPFVDGGSGQPVAIAGSHFVELHMDGMAITDDAGTPTYIGKSSYLPAMLALRQVEMTEAFEGVYNFVIGYDGNGCVGLAGDEAARNLVITIGH